jgi:SAM-dependent methyltransferase
MTSSDPSEYVPRNVAVWSEDDDYLVESGRQAWSRGEIDWGVWRVPEAELRVLPDVNGLDVVELGCGTAYFSSWLVRCGARVVGVDPTPAQLERARAFQREFELEFPLVEAGAEAVPLPDASFDLALSEYGASIWSDPYLWVPEAARLLRPGGLLVFLRNSTLLILCSPDEGKAEERLVRQQFGMHRFSWDGAEFHLAHGDWIRLLRANGFEIEDLIEIQAPPDARTHEHYDFVTAEWGRKWPAEEIWKARKRPYS